jgi:hypothetical protein
MLGVAEALLEQSMELQLLVGQSHQEQRLVG